MEAIKFKVSLFYTMVVTSSNALFRGFSLIFMVFLH